jgi:hypothetical protein
MAKMTPTPLKMMSVDERLADHLKQAEFHLIEALKLFERTRKPVRPAGFISRLTRAQEITTTLMREELVRARGTKRAA